jgi:hypothetical protein
MRQKSTDTQKIVHFGFQVHLRQDDGLRCPRCDGSAQCGAQARNPKSSEAQGQRTKLVFNDSQKPNGANDKQLE